jgi:hypothetical protein
MREQKSVNYYAQYHAAKERLEAIQTLHDMALAFDDLEARKSACERALEEFAALRKLAQESRTLLLAMLVYRGERLIEKMRRLCNG